MAPFLREKNLEWLIFYESFLEKYNCELLPVLDAEIPALERSHEVKDSRGKRAQVLRLRTE